VSATTRLTDTDVVGGSRAEVLDTDTAWGDRLTASMASPLCGAKELDEAIAPVSASRLPVLHTSDGNVHFERARIGEPGDLRSDAAHLRQSPFATLSISLARERPWAAALAPSGWLPSLPPTRE
jgi:hypothetical protein